MRILLLGEFSGLHHALAKGLRELGHAAQVASAGDGFKDIPADIRIPTFAGQAGRLVSIWRWAHAYREAMRADIVQAINPFYSGPRAFLWSLARVRAKQDNFFLLSAGSDAVYWREGRQRLPYGPFETLMKTEPKAAVFFMSESGRRFNLEIARLAAAVVPTAPEYEISYAGFSNVAPMIPFPVDVSSLDYADNRPRQRIVVAHGLNRSAKGSAIIAEAFDALSTKYPRDLDLRLYERTSRSAFISNLADCNVYVDQLYSQSGGLSALQALACGRVVIGGNESDNDYGQNRNQSPIVNVRPSVDSVVRAVEAVLSQRDRFVELGFQGRRYVESWHHYREVAAKYTEVWTRDRAPKAR